MWLVKNYLLCLESSSVYSATTKLDTLSEQSGPDLTPLAKRIGDNQELISDNIAGISNNAKSNEVLEKEIELLKLQIEEIKVSTSNPLSN